MYREQVDGSTVLKLCIQLGMTVYREQVDGSTVRKVFNLE